MEKLKALFQLLYSKLMAIGPDLLVAILILIIGILVAYGTKKLALITIQKYRTQGIVRSFGILSAAQINWLAIIISRIIFWITIIIFIAMTAEILGINIFEEWFKALGNFIPNILAGILILLTGIFLSGLIRDFLQKSLSAAGIASAKAISIAIYIISIVIVLLITVNQIGIDIKFLTSIIEITLAGIFICGAISFGIGSAPIVTNIISTYYLRKALKIGQSIELEGITGRIIEINATTIHLQTQNGLEVVPSSKLEKMGYKIKNESN